jgi:spore coat protein U-like protein
LSVNTPAYELYQTSITSGDIDRWVKVAETNKATYKVYGLENTKSYKFKVRSKTQCESGKYSEALFVTRSTVSQ